MSMSDAADVTVIVNQALEAFNELFTNSMGGFNLEVVSIEMG